MVEVGIGSYPSLLTKVVGLLSQMLLGNTVDIFSFSSLKITYYYFDTQECRVFLNVVSWSY